jgi:hypothetical protein
MTDEDKIIIAQRAIYYVLNRIRKDPEARRVFGVASESFDLLTAAGAALSGEPVHQVRDYVVPGSSQIHRTTPEEIVAKL